MNTEYDLEAWAAETTSGRRVFNYGYRMLGTEIKGWKLLKVVTLQETADATEKAYIWQNEKEPEREMIRVDITERHNWRQAQETLQQQLMQCMRPDIPRGTKDLARVGDVSFAGREPQTDLAAALSFVRGNECVSVSSVGERNVDVSKIATKLDRALSSPPAKREMDRGEMRTLAPEATKVEADVAHVLIDSLEKASRTKWLKVIVPDGELSREGDALVYVSPEGGEKRVRTFAGGRE